MSIVEQACEALGIEPTGDDALKAIKAKLRAKKVRIYIELWPGSEQCACIKLLKGSLVVGKGEKSGEQDELEALCKAVVAMNGLRPKMDREAE